MYAILEMSNKSNTTKEVITMDNMIKNGPEYMRKIREETERELAAERETAVCEVDNYHLYRAQDDGKVTWDHAVVAQNLARMHEEMLMCVGTIDEDIYTLLYLSTIAEACLVRADEETGEYKSALIILADLDNLVVMADTKDASIMAGVNEHFVMHLKLPFAELIHRQTQKYYDAARSTRELESITTPTGEVVKVLFAHNY